MLGLLIINWPTNCEPAGSYILSVGQKYSTKEIWVTLKSDRQVLYELACQASVTAAPTRVVVVVVVVDAVLICIFNIHYYDTEIRETTPEVDANHTGAATATATTTTTTTESSPLSEAHHFQYVSIRTSSHQCSCCHNNNHHRRRCCCCYRAKLS